MLTIVHGDDITASRNFFINAKKRTTAPISLEVDQITVTEVTQLMGSGGLFGDKQDVFIESLLTKKRKSNELSAILILFSAEETINVYLWEGKEIDKKTLTPIPQLNNQLFTLPKSLFQFLESLRPNNPNLIKLFHQTLTTVEPEMIFFMLIRQLRFLIAVSSRSSDTIEEVRRMAPWQRTKLEKQSRLIKPEKLVVLYRKLYEIDAAQKTGKLPTTLSNAIDFWLMEL